MHRTKNAFCIPGERLSRTTTSFGVYDENGLVPHCEIETSPWVSQPQPTALPPRNAPRIHGPTLFAGSADFHFGFILLNALGRLYALGDLPENTTLFFAVKPMNGPNPIRVLPQLLRSMGIQNPLVISEFATYFDELITVPEHFGESCGGKGSADFYRWIDRCWPPGPINFGSKVYLTRSGLNARRGRYACEDHLETLLRAEGYTIIAPETLTLAEQVALYQTTERLIFAEGSALHLFSLLRRPGQVAAVIQRGKDLPAVMLAQMQDRIGAPPIAIDAVEDIFWPPLRGDHLGISVLDFDRLGAELAIAGLIRGDAWHPPSDGAIEASLNAALSEGQKFMRLEERNAWLRQFRAGKRLRGVA